MRAKTHNPMAPTSEMGAPSSSVISPHEGRVDTLNSMTDLEQVMTFPFTRMGDYQAYQEQKQGMSVLLRRILMGANDADRETPFFLGILRAASDIDDDLTSAMQKAREGIKARYYRATPKAQTRIGLPRCYSVAKRRLGAVVAIKVRLGGTDPRPDPRPDHALHPEEEQPKEE